MNRDHSQRIDPPRLIPFLKKDLNVLKLSANSAIPPQPLCYISIWVDVFDSFSPIGKKWNKSLVPQSAVNSFSTIGVGVRTEFGTKKCHKFIFAPHAMGWKDYRVLKWIECDRTSSEARHHVNDVKTTWYLMISVRYSAHYHMDSCHYMKTGRISFFGRSI